VAEKCRSLAPSQSFSAELDASEIRKMAYVIGASHDVGKATRYFQEYVKTGKNLSTQLKSHSFLSSLYAFYAAREVGFDLGLLIPVCIQLIVMSHHSVLRSPTMAVTRLFGARDMLSHQLKAIQAIDELDSALEKMRMPLFHEFINEGNTLTLEFGKTVARLAQEQHHTSRELLLPFFAVNLSLSTLTDADRMDAARLAFPAREDVRARDVEDYVRSLSEEAKKSKNVDYDVVKARELLFEILAKKASTIPVDRRVFSITAPTGYGKTLSGLHFALRLRERLYSQGLRPRVIYVAPFLSILDQNFEAIRKALGIGLGQSNILLVHHHLAEMNYKPAGDLDETYSTLDSELLIEGWNSEVIITTFIQFFYSILGNTASQLRRFHNLEGSIILLDEVQSIPHEYWKLVHDIILFLSERFKMYIIFMTATQPLIFEPDEINELVEAFPNEQQKTRTSLKIKIYPELSVDKFSKEMIRLTDSSPQNSILVVLNTVRSAIEVYHSIDTDRKKYYLSANIVPKQRRERLGTIVDALKKREPIILVSTQVVEAGVDLDFDMAVRDIGPIDSIIQVAGRCNRNGTRETARSPVYVYLITDENGHEYGRQIYGNYLIEKTKEVLVDSGTDCNLSQLASTYYRRVRVGASELRSHELLSSMHQLDYQGLENFKLIDDQDSASVYVELDQEAENIWETYERLVDKYAGLQAKEAFLKIRQAFYSYVVNVPEKDVRSLHKMKGFYRIPHSSLNEFYDCDTGFRR
jgi:CRISPR-associated endonuclease/helicase Cas3